mmetsp:Transcript_63219/g.137488  ORF Transcript_63219/g.137488 Transcript_63219/m.137488 type:complete len:290 (+) Transcript_63219:20-889(+)
MKFQLPVAWALCALLRWEAAFGRQLFTSTDDARRRVLSVISAGSSHGLGGEFFGVRRRERTLRICNAYAVKGGINVFFSRALPASVPSSRPAPVQLTEKDVGLMYKSCVDLPVTELLPGSVLEFRIRDMHVGAFRVTEEPPEGSMLQLVVYRNDRATTAADFVSHVFEETRSPEVLVVDAYRGEARSSLNISGTQLSFGTAVELRPGTYECQLSPTSTGEAGEEARPVSEIRASEGQKYTAIRVGVQALVGPSYPEELVLFGAAERAKLWTSLVIVILSGVLSQWLCAL